MDALRFSVGIQQLVGEFMQANENGMSVPREVPAEPDLEDARCDLMRRKTDQVTEAGRNFVRGLQEVLEEFPELADGLFAWQIGAFLKQANEIILKAIDPDLSGWEEPVDADFEVVA